MMTPGRVKWFNREKGFGFIETEKFRHVLIHHTCIENGCGFYNLKESDKVLIQIKDTLKGPEAVRVEPFEAN